MKKPKTLAEHIKAHEALWKGIAKYIRKNKSEEPPETIKTKVFRKIFGRMEIANLCFACEWDSKSASWKADFSAESWSWLSTMRACFAGGMYQKSCCNGRWNKFLYHPTAKNALAVANCRKRSKK